METVPEEVTVISDALDFIDREIERAEMLAREQEWLTQLEAGTLDLKLLNVPLYDYQTARCPVPGLPRPQHPRRRHGPRQDRADARRGRTARPRARRQTVLVVAPASVKYQWEAEIRKFTGRPVQVIEGGPDDRRDQYAARPSTGW